MNTATLGIKKRPRPAAEAGHYTGQREETVARAFPLLRAVPARSKTSVQNSPVPPITVNVQHDLATAADGWSAFEQTANGTLYQAHLWCRSWMETVGVNLRVKPVIVTGQDATGDIMFLLPLQIRRRYGVAVLEWLGAPHGNYGHGLYAPRFAAMARAWFDENFAHVLGLAGDFDAISLREMPEHLQGAANPLAGHFNLKGANRSYNLQLCRGFEELHARKRDGEDRRSARRKLRMLEDKGTVEFGLPTTPADLHLTLDTMFRHQELRLAERGVHGVFGPHERQFVHRLAELQNPDRPILAPYTLKLNGEVLAVLLGGVHHSGYWALISSLAPGDHRKLSPGDLALRKTIEACCGQGLGWIDFSSGDSQYKQSWADNVVELRSIIGGRTMKGLAFAAALAAHETVKRAVKRSPAMMAAIGRLRTALRGRPAVRPSSN